MTSIFPLRSVTIPFSSENSFTALIRPSWFSGVSISLKLVNSSACGVTINSHLPARASKVVHERAERASASKTVFLQNGRIFRIASRVSEAHPSPMPNTTMSWELIRSVRIERSLGQSKFEDSFLTIRFGE